MWLPTERGKVDIPVLLNIYLNISIERLAMVLRIAFIHPDLGIGEDYSQIIPSTQY